MRLFASPHMLGTAGRFPAKVIDKKWSTAYRSGEIMGRVMRPVAHSSAAFYGNQTNGQTS